MGIPTTLVVSIAQRLLENIWKDKSFLQALAELSKIGRICACLERIESMLARSGSNCPEGEIEVIKEKLEKCPRTGNFEISADTSVELDVKKSDTGGLACASSFTTRGCGFYLVYWDSAGNVFCRFSAAGKFDRRWKDAVGTRGEGFFVVCAGQNGSVLECSRILNF